MKVRLKSTRLVLQRLPWWVLIPLFLIGFILFKIPKLPIFDEWYILGNQFLDVRGPLSPGVLFEPVNEHRIPWARIFFGWNGFSGYSQIRLMCLSVLASCLSFLLLQKIFWKQSKTIEMVFWSVAFFTFSQWEAYFMGMVLHFYLYTLGTLMGIYGLTKKSLPLILFSIVFCSGFLASWLLFCLALMVGIVYLDLSLKKKTFWLSTIFLLAVFLQRLLSTGGTAKLLIAELFAEPVTVFGYFTTYVGGALYFLAKDPWITGFLGVMGMTLLLFFAFRKQKIFSLELGVLWLHLFLLAIVTAMARAQFGASHGTASRYVVLSLPAWFALMLLLRQSSQKYFRMLGFVLLIFLQVASVRGFAWYVTKKLPERVAAQDCYEKLSTTNNWNTDICDEKLGQVVHSARDMRQIVEKLKVVF